MLTWINFLHFYQPPTASQEQINQVVKETYQSWVDFLIQHPKTKLTLNISACLTERLFNSGYEKLLNQISKLASKKQIELVGSASTHPILPLLPSKEIINQIQINHQINSSRLGKAYKPQGFYLPEMAYSKEVGKIIKKMGYKYIILDEISLTKDLKQTIDNNIKYQTKYGLTIVFRNRQISKTFVPQTIIDVLKQNKEKNQPLSQPYLVTATDGELYGHRYWNWWPAYSCLVKQVKTLTISEYLKKIKQTKTIKLITSSWESTPNELKKNIPFALWNNPKNKLHEQIWQLAEFALKLNYQNKKDTNHFASRLHLENGLASCTFWWASKKDFGLFSPRAWDPSMVEQGAQELLWSVRSLDKISKHDKLKAEKIFGQIRNIIWHSHWK